MYLISTCNFSFNIFFQSDDYVMGYFYKRFVKLTNVRR